MNFIVFALIISFIILNILDGILETPGRILIMTSNYPEKLDKAFMLTNSINDAWWNNKDVVCLEKTRSTMSGDQVVIKGHTYECMDRGWRSLG